MDTREGLDCIMIKTEIKRALHSRAFVITTAFCFFMMIEGRLDQSNGRIFSDSEPYLAKFLNSLFFTPLTILWPITVMFPFVLSYRKERDSGYERLMVLKASRWQYRKAKIAAVACSGFLSLFLPMTGWLFFCKFMLGSGRVVNPILFMPEFAENYPFLYGMMYTVNAGVLGVVFAVWGLGLSAVVRNRYLALLIPVCYCVFTGVAAPGAWQVFKLIVPSAYSNPVLGRWGIPVYELALFTIGCLLFIGGDHHVGKA